jgi:hypothetical protein
MAKVLLKEPAMPGTAAVLDALRQIRPKIGPLEVLEEAPGRLVLSIEGRKAAVSLVAEPVPHEELAQATAAAWYWPEAAIVLGGHRAQALLGVEAESSRRVDAGMLLTAQAAAVAEAAGGLGVQWTAAGLFHSTEAVATYARQMDSAQLPLYVWIDFHVYRDPEGNFSLTTRGLEAFGSLEIEVAQSSLDPQSLIGRVYDIAHFVLEKGVLLRDGETIGVTQDERIAISVGPSREHLEKKVIQLAM